MEPISPVIPNQDTRLETIVAEHQIAYNPLPVFCTKYSSMSRWRLTDDERKYIADGGDLFIAQLNGIDALQPILPIAMDADAALHELLACEAELEKFL